MITSIRFLKAVCLYKLLLITYVNLIVPLLQTDNTRQEQGPTLNSTGVQNGGFYL